MSFTRFLISTMLVANMQTFVLAEDHRHVTTFASPASDMSIIARETPHLVDSRFHIPASITKALVNDPSAAASLASVFEGDHQPEWYKKLPLSERHMYINKAAKSSLHASSVDKAYQKSLKSDASLLSKAAHHQSEHAKDWSELANLRHDSTQAAGASSISVWASANSQFAAVESKQARSSASSLHVSLVAGLGGVLLCLATIS